MRRNKQDNKNTPTAAALGTAASSLPIWRCLPLLALAALALATTILASLAQAAEQYCVSCTSPDIKYNCQVDTGTAAIPASALQLYCIKQLARLGGHESCSVKRREVAPCRGEVKILDYAGEKLEDRPLQIRTPQQPPGQTNEQAGGAAAGAGAAITAERSKPEDPLPGSFATGANGQSTGARPSSTAAQQAPARPPATTGQGPARAKLKPVKNPLQKASEAVTKTAKKTGQAIGSAVKKTGQGIASAAKKTWNCLTTFFSKC